MTDEEILLLIYFEVIV